MSKNDANDEPKIIIDSDWKEDAAKEKARLSDEVDEAASQEAIPDPSLFEVINMIVMQASLSLGGYTSPEGKTVPADLGVAKHYIDLLELLQTKTAGNVTDDEENVLKNVLHELRMGYVQTATGNPPAPPAP